jgi:hypothetical protein
MLTILLLALIQVPTYTYYAPIDAPAPAGTGDTGKLKGCYGKDQLGYYEYDEAFKSGQKGKPTRHFEPYAPNKYDPKDPAEMRFGRMWTCRGIAK